MRRMILLLVLMVGTALVVAGCETTGSADASKGGVQGVEVGGETTIRGNKWR